MAANSEEAIAEDIEVELQEIASPAAPRSFSLEDTNNAEDDGRSDEILDGEEDGERNPLLELKKCKEWLLQQKINHESELLVRKLLVSSILEL